MLARRVEPLEDRTLLATFTVTTTMDSGPGSLREAIQLANAQAGPHTIEFDLAADDPGHVYYGDDGVAGQVTTANIRATTEADDADISDIDPDWAYSWWTISPLSQLPAITSVVTIDGYTQMGAAENSNGVGQGLNTVLRVEINGEQSAVEGANISTGLLTLRGGNSTVRGLALNRHLGPGILVDSNGNNTVAGNFIGTDVSGTAAFNAADLPGVNVGAIGYHGVRVASSGNVIGGTTPERRNLISGNTGGPPSALDNFGVQFVSDPNRLEGNLIGTNRSGMVALPNGSGGVSAGSRNTIGGADPNAANVISGNVIGVQLANTNLVQNNLIGTDPTGTLNVGNTAVGVLSGFNANNNQILENTVAFNGAAPPAGGISGSTSAAGIRVVFGTVGTGNLISRNSIFGNFGPGIDLGTDGFTPNDVPPASDPPDQDTGANGLQNTPLLTSVTAVGGGTEVLGLLQSTPNSDLRIEFFANRNRNFEADPSGKFTGGEVFLGFIDVSTDADGNADIAATLAALPANMPYVSATATDVTDNGSGPRNNTSEFSPAAVVGGLSFVVTNTNDTGIGSLREAIVSANLTPGPQTITFNIPADDPRHFYYTDDGVAGQVTFENTTVTTETDDANIIGIDPDWTHSWFGIILDTALPEIVDTVTIDGYSQAGAMENTLTFDDDQGLNTILKIELDGRFVAGNGFTLGFDGLNSDAAGSVIRGFAINAFGGDGIQVNTLSGGNTIAGNFIGADVSGTLNFGNGGNGVFLVIDEDDVIGGPNAADRNLISGNIGNGILVLSSLRTLIQGNLLGGDRTSESFFETSSSSIRFNNDDDLVPAITSPSTIPVFKSSITTNDPDSEVRLAPFTTAQSSQNSVSENRFTTGDELHVLEIIWPSFEGKLAKTTPTERAVVKHVTNNRPYRQKYVPPSTQQPQVNAGVLSANNVATVITAFDLNGDGVTPNDPLDADEGPNGLQNYPDLSSAITDAGVTTVSGTLHSLPSTSFRIEIYSSSYDTTFFRAGERSLGTIDVTTDAAGNAAFVFVSPVVVPLGHDIISLATRLEDGTLTPIETSEFSAGLKVTNGQPPAPVRHDLLALRTSDGRFEAQESNGTQFLRDTDYGLLAPTADLVDHRVGDFDGDGLDDVAARNNATGAVTVALSDGTQMVPATWALWSTNATWKHVVVGDFDGDGKDDLAGLAGSGTVLVSLSNGTGFTNSSFGAVSGSVNWVDMFSGDVNNDGLDDVVLRSSTGAWVAGLSDGGRFTFSVFGRWSSTVNWRDVTVGDFNGDGRLDVVGRSPSGKVVVGLSDGMQFNFSEFAAWSTLVDWQIVIGDFNNDGRDDIVARASSGTVVMNLSIGTGFTRAVWGSLSTAVDWQFHVGDFNGDGESDLAGIASTGTIAVGLSTGSSFNFSGWGAWPNRESRTPYLVGNFVEG
ncbi:MAG: VCBS repeat-containing protein [Planctomycetaceae bacterium]|nr:VCBS repeat-containing protein [Planctomycetaceae bacterium]